MIDFLQYKPGRLTSAAKFRVWMPGTADSCSILEALLDAPDGRKMLRLFDEVVMTGLPKDNIEKCRHLEGPVFELKRGPKRGPKLRVFGFRDKERIVLPEINLKKRDDNPAPYIRKCLAFREHYMQAQQTNQIKVHYLTTQEGK